MLEDNLRAVGILTLSLRDQYGNVKQEVTVPNTVVNAGKAFIAQSMTKTTSNTPAAMTHMGVGSGTVAVAPADTTLGTQLGTRATVTPTNTTVTVTNDTIQYVATFSAGNGTGAVTEAGIFNASSAGTMLCRTVFSVINKGADDSLTITWRVTIQ
jgi:hypothetical protein